jgi:hypothetical protein
MAPLCQQRIKESLLKLKKPEELFIELGIELDYGVGKLADRHIRYSDYTGCLDIGDLDFDKWGNSVDFSFDLWQAKGQRQFLRWHEEYMQSIESEELV